MTSSKNFLDELGVVSDVADGEVQVHRKPALGARIELAQGCAALEDEVVEHGPLGEVAQEQVLRDIDQRRFQALALGWCVAMNMSDGQPDVMLFRHPRPTASS